MKCKCGSTPTDHRDGNDAGCCELNFDICSEPVSTTLTELEIKVEKLTREHAIMKKALIRLRDCDWVIRLPDRMDAVRDIARDALKEI